MEYRCSVGNHTIEHEKLYVCCDCLDKLAKAKEENIDLLRGLSDLQKRLDRVLGGGLRWKTAKHAEKQ